MSKKRVGLNQKGFTLIELISVMIIMGVVASVSIQKFDLLSDTASQQALYSGIKELNIRESLTWTNLKISNTGYSNDEELYPLIDTDLGSSYKWNPGPAIGGGTLHFRSHSKALTRVPSTEKSAAKWE
ncbi:MAG: prepilin-type N-terminal cleavage/methylation domain-containing protein [Desulfobacterales bacterium]|jgi:prepilin-type N-terminal cleavage/methylation domain-containing protein